MNMLLEHLNGYILNLKDIINPYHLVINLIVCTSLAQLVGAFFVNYGNAVSNRKRFAANFVPLALTTMSIMVIVKPSVALSLGLVGALSIVRFRAAIKDPEELTYLFLVIAIGLATGADQPLIAILIIVFILVFLYLSKRVSNDNAFRASDRLYINIRTDLNNIVEIEKLLSTIFKDVNLKRMDTLKNGLDLSFVCNMESVDQLQTLKEALNERSEDTLLSIIDQPDLII